MFLHGSPDHLHQDQLFCLFELKKLPWPTNIMRRPGRCIGFLVSAFIFFILFVKPIRSYPTWTSRIIVPVQCLLLNILKNMCLQLTRVFH